MVDPLDHVVFRQRHGVEATGVADQLKRRFELAQRLRGRLGADVLVTIEQHLVVDVADRHERAREASLGLRGAGALL